MIVEWMASKTAKKIKNTDPEHTASIEVLEYGLKIIYNALLITSLSLIIGEISGKILETLIGMGSFAILRFFSGGVHIKSSDWCALVSILIITLIANVSISVNTSQVLTIISLLLILLFGAKDMQSHLKIGKKYNLIMKFASMLLILIFMKFETVVVAFFIQSLTLISFKNRKKDS